MPDETRISERAFIRENVSLGKNISIGSFTEIAPGCVIGDNVRIHSQCFIAENTVIEADVWLGPQVLITNCFHPKCEHAKQCMKGAHIGESTIVGAGVIILPEVTIGAGAFIGAGSLVTKDIPAGALAYGNPAMVRGFTATLKCKKGSKCVR